jgi:hypothetical protein
MLMPVYGGESSTGMALFYHLLGLGVTIFHISEYIRVSFLDDLACLGASTLKSGKVVG